MHVYAVWAHENYWCRYDFPSEIQLGFYEHSLTSPDYFIILDSTTKRWIAREEIHPNQTTPSFSIAHVAAKTQFN